MIFAERSILVYISVTKIILIHLRRRDAIVTYGKQPVWYYVLVKERKKTESRI